MSTTTTGTRTYVIDNTHSSAHFSVRHLMISKVRGSFKTISGTVTLPESGPVPTAITVEIDAASIDTGEAQRDGHLKSPDFFDVEKFPNLAFTSTAITASGDESFEAAGELEIHGVKQPVTVTVNVAGQGKDPWGNDRIAYETSFKINRKDYGLVWNQALEAGGVAVGDHIDISIDVETVPKPA
jgi:polyisoprenoid-binding protein YceI